MSKIIGILSGNAGVGKATLVINLCAAFAERGKEAVVVECDIANSHLGSYSGMCYYPITINHVLRGDAEITDITHDSRSGMKIIPFSLKPDDISGVDFTKLRDAIRMLSDDGVIILDAAPGLGREAAIVMRISDELLYIMTPSTPAVSDAIKCRNIADEIGRAHIGLVLNMISDESHELAKKDFERMTGLPVVATVPLDEDVHRSLNASLPVVQFSPKSKSSLAFKRLAAFILNKRYEETFFERLKNVFSLIKKD